MRGPDEQQELSRLVERIAVLRRQSAETAKELEELTRRIELCGLGEEPPPDVEHQGPPN